MEIVKPGIEAVVMFRAVQRRVRAAIKQEPYLGFNALGDVYLAGAEPPKTSAVATAPSARPQSSEAAEAWAATKDTTNIVALELFVGRYKDTYFADLARMRIEELKRQQVAVATPPAQSAPAKPTQPAAAVTPARPALSCDGVETQVGNERKCLKSKDSFRDCAGCPEMVVVPSGSFTMGSPQNEPQRSSDEEQVRVSITSPFAVGKFAVTFAEWDACAADGGCNGYKPADERWGRGKRPVINVSWDDAKAYTAWLSRKTGKSYRLLSEAEREYVTRAGTTTAFWWGSAITPKQANYNATEKYNGGGSKGEWRYRTVPVDSFEPNPWGLYNVHGNVSEWTEDCWNESNSGNPGDGSARTTGDCTEHVLRGLSWNVPPRSVRAAVRDGGSTGARASINGFRLARTLNP